MRKIVYLCSLLVIFVIPWEEVITISGIGSVTRILGVLLTAIWMGSILHSGQIRKIRPLHLVILAFILWNFVSLLWTSDLEDSTSRLITFVQLGILIWIIWDIYTTPTLVRAGMQAYVLGAWVSVYSTLSNYLAGNLAHAGSKWTRYSGFGFNANGLAIVLAIGLPIAWYLVTSETRRTQLFSILRIVNAAYVPFAMFAILLTASRGGLLATLPFLFYFFSTLTRIKLTQRILLSFGLMGVLYFVQPLIPQASLDRLSTTSSEITDGDLNGRRTIWEEGLEVFATSPIGGVGTGTFQNHVANGKVAHNAYISVLVELGIVGFSLFILIFLLSVYHTRYLPRSEAALWITVVLIWAVGVTALSWEYKKYTWLIVSYILISANASREKTPVMDASIGSSGILKKRQPVDDAILL